MKTKFIAILLGAMGVYHCSQAQLLKEANSVQMIINSGSDANGTWKVQQSIDQDGNVLAYDSSYVRNDYQGSIKNLGDNDASAMIKSLQEKLNNAFSDFDLGAIDWNGSDSTFQLDNGAARIFRMEEGLDGQLPQFKEMIDELMKVQEQFFNRENSINRTEKSKSPSNIKDNTIDM